MSNAAKPTLSSGINGETKETMDVRRADWRIGHVVYQIFLDRFAPSDRLDEKRALYASPRRLMSWDEEPSRGAYLHDEHISEAETQFWGGDLHSLMGQLDYLRDLGVDLVYLNPVFEAFSNHKYDASDFRKIDPAYGTNEDLGALSRQCHERGMRLMLDGVFNHIGRRSAHFQSAIANGSGKNRDHYYIGENYRNGYRGWRNVANLPELNLENPDVREMVYRAEDSIVQGWIRDAGIDGWRLDVAPDLGFEVLGELTDAAHSADPQSCVIGETWNYPEEWLHVLDGVMNMHARLLILNLCDGKMGPGAFATAFERMVDDSDYEGLLRSHMVLDNHDVPRIQTLLEDPAMLRMARVLQFTLPGCPVIYYGSELGMKGGHDPLNRGPMRWETANDENEDLTFIKKLTAIRREFGALRYGNYRRLDAEELVAFSRTTDCARDTILVFANPSDEEVHDIMAVRNSRLMDVAPLECLLSGDHISMHCGVAEVTLPPKSIRVFRTLDWDQPGGYSLYKRVP